MLHSHVVEAGYASLLGLLAAAFYFLASRRETYRLWGHYIVGFMLFVSLRTFADETGIPVHYAYPATFAGELTGQALSNWLQRAFYTPGRVGLLDIVTTGLYLSYFAAHYLLSLLLWRFQPAQFRVYIYALLAACFIGLLGYFLVPAAPPWLASQQGLIDPVVRIPQALGDQLANGAYARASSVAGTNDVAAMPSLHLAITVVVAIAAVRARPSLRWLAAAYVLSMGFSLLYLGEHYLLDLLAGCALAAIAYGLACSLIGLSAGEEPAAPARPLEP